MSPKTSKYYSNERNNEYFIDNNIDKVLFLDIDGVLKSYNRISRLDSMENNSIESFYQQLKEKYNIDYSLYNKQGVISSYFDWDKNSISILKDLLITSSAKIVLSSDWRLLGYKQMYDLFRFHDLHEFYIDNTINLTYLPHKLKEKLENKYTKLLKIDTFWVPHYRTVEILNYLKRHPFIKNYVAIDDKNIPCIESHFVKTSDLLLPQHANMALKILKT
ncbi:MAG: hypothetical protein LBI10_04630 [Deltaproteobacteria bacterium]|jgi:hypothetical protein|nr:hypothetical protein [Deltaproteobacteria bacterium]